MADSVKIAITGDDSQFRSTLKGIASTAQGVFGGIANSSLIRGGLASLQSGLGLVKTGMEAAAQAGMAFESAMSKVGAISGASADELRRLEEAAKQAGATTQFTATDAANALSYMALAGWDANQSMDALGGVLNLAAASGMDLAQASDMVTDYLSAFGMEAKQAAYMSDMMSYAQANSNTTAAMLGEAYGNCAASMHAAGQDIETTTAMLEALANQGIKGSEAGTQMAAVMRDLTQKMDDGKIMIGETAIAVMDAQGNFRDLTDIIADVGKATEGLGTAEASAAIMETFTARSVKAVQTILNEGIDNVSRYEAELRNAAGTAEAQAEQMLDNLQGDVTVMQSALEALQITAYDSFSGVARAGVQEFTALITGINQAGKNGGISGMFDAVIAKIPSLLGKLQGAVGKLIGGLGKKLPDLAKQLIKAMPDSLKNLSDIIPQLTESLGATFGAAVEGLISSLPKLAPALAQGIGKMFVSAVKGMGSALTGIWDGIRDLFSDHTYENIWDGLIAGADASRKATISAQIDGTVDTSPAETAITTAVENVRTLLSGLGLDESLKSAIVSAVEDASGWNLFRETLQSFGLTTDEVEQVETAIHGGISSINSALEGLGLSDEAKAHILALASDENTTKDDIKKALESMGVDPADADTVASGIISARDSICSKLVALGIDPTTALQMAVGAFTDRTLIETCLKALGVPQDVIDGILTEYDTAASSISGKLNSLYSDIYTALTDGKEDSPDVMKDLEDEVRTIYSDAVEAINKWAQEEIEKLNPDSATYTQEVEAIEKKASELKGQLETQENAFQTWLTSMAGQSAETVRQHLGELQEIMTETNKIIQQATAQEVSEERKAYNLVTHGMARSDENVGLALDYANWDFQTGMSAAFDRYEAAMRDFRNGVSEKSEAEIEAEFEAEKARLSEGYKNMLMNVLGSLAQGDLGDAGIDIEQLRKAMKLDEIYNELYANSAEDNSEAKQQIIDQNRELIMEALGESADIDNMSFAQIADAIAGKMNESLAGAFTAENMPTLAAALATCIENGLFDGTELADMDNDEIMAMLSGLLTVDEPVETSVPVEATASEVTLAEGEAAPAETVQQAVTEAVENAEPVEASVPVEATPEVTTTTGEESGISEAVTTELESQTMSVDVAADVKLTVTVSDSNAESVGTTAGEALGTALATGVAGKAQDVTNAADTIVKGAMSKFGAASGAAYQWGRNTGEGFRLGLASKREAILATARGIADSVAKTISDALEINSPSRVMRRLGAFTGEGFDIGLSESLSAAIRNADGIVGALNLNPGTAASGIVGAINGSAGGMEALSDAILNRPTVLMVNGRELARATQRDTQIMQNNAQRRMNISVSGV